VQDGRYRLPAAWHLRDARNLLPTSNRSGLRSNCSAFGSEETPIEELASVRRTNGTYSFPVSGFHERAFVICSEGMSETRLISLNCDAPPCLADVGCPASDWCWSHGLRTSDRRPCQLAQAPRNKNPAIGIRSSSNSINKITTNTVEIASIRIYARALQSSVEIARLGPAARNDALTIRTADPYPLSAATRAPRHLAVPPRPSRAAQAAA
jgi:hypothetical protein